MDESNKFNFGRKKLDAKGNMLNFYKFKTRQLQAILKEALPLGRVGDSL